MVNSKCYDFLWYVYSSYTGAFMTKRKFIDS